MVFRNKTLSPLAVSSLSTTVPKASNLFHIVVLVLMFRGLCTPWPVGLMSLILWLQAQSHLSAELHCPKKCLYVPRDANNGPIKKSIKKYFNQSTQSDITESPEFSFKIGTHRWKTLIAVVTSLVSKCILFMLCCWWNWLLMCILRGTFLYNE